MSGPLSAFVVFNILFFATCGVYAVAGVAEWLQKGNTHPMSNLKIRVHEATQTESLANVEYRILNALVDVYEDDPEQGETDFYKDYAVDPLLNSNDYYTYPNERNKNPHPTSPNYTTISDKSFLHISTN